MMGAVLGIYILCIVAIVLATGLLALGAIILGLYAIGHHAAKRPSLEPKNSAGVDWNAYDAIMSGDPVKPRSYYYAWPDGELPDPADIAKHD